MTHSPFGTRRQLVPSASHGARAPRAAGPALTGIVLSIAILPGCFGSHGMPLDPDAGPRPDAPAIAPDGDMPPPLCGSVICGVGQVCCSASCSVCGPAGAVCPDIDCLPSCDAMDARGEGACRLLHGYRWSGASCEPVSGCECLGADCGALYLSADLCAANHGHCSPASCGGFGGLPCGPDQFCDYPDGSFCGGDDSTGVCRPRPRECLEPGGVPVCGCDGVEYLDACPANFAGTDVAHFGSCGPPMGGFRAARATPSCGPADGPAWELTFTAAPEACDAATQPRIVVQIWGDLNVAPPRTYLVGTGAGAGGVASRCASPGGPCSTLSGEVIVEFFATGEVARVAYALTDGAGAVYNETSIEITSFCAVTFPGCG